MKFIPVTIPPEDAQFLGSRAFQTAEIARIFDVPLILLQSHEKTTSWGTGIEQLMIGFVQQTIAPWVMRGSRSSIGSSSRHPRSRRAITSSST
jgi:phage portal protein BeeE